jgi:uncharacterized membrane protein
VGKRKKIDAITPPHAECCCIEKGSRDAACYVPTAKRRTMMTEHQLLGIMMVIQGLLLIVGLMIALQIYREARDSAQKSREVEQLVSASLEVAREILRQVKR